MNESKTKRTAGPRLQHVVVHYLDDTDPTTSDTVTFDQIVVFGQELDALRHIVGKTGWVYAAVAHGQSFRDALKAATS